MTEGCGICGVPVATVCVVCYQKLQADIEQLNERMEALANELGRVQALLQGHLLLEARLRQLLEDFDPLARGAGLEAAQQDVARLRDG